MSEQAEEEEIPTCPHSKCNAPFQGQCGYCGTNYEHVHGLNDRAPEFKEVVIDSDGKQIHVSKSGSCQLRKTIQLERFYKNDPEHEDGESYFIDVEEAQHLAWSS